ncbi:hypothetical protein FA95DRAFT_1559520 [Auriscalpium vulgare]|uniref:Uncharacterized protein n=1 Tax=Auriscalpium vulgare TaxID=40419 RepID=A0ACB8RSG3_9AGAM|nr:hypothetical protein FA95DRAFT_1559520 [Auriscalpium vulgare]
MNTPSTSASSSSLSISGVRPHPSRLLSTLRRSLSSSSSPKLTKSVDDLDMTRASRHRTSDPDPAETRPSVAQIAMGLHLSRTPHLPPHLSHLSPAYPPPPHEPHPRPRRASHHHHTRSLAPVHVAPRLPPPPTRSALKKPGSASASSRSPSTSPVTGTGSRPASALTLTSVSSAPSSTAPSTPSSGSPRSRFARFLGVGPRGRHTRSLVAVEAVVVEPDARKAVRFEEVDGEN